jgi:hypothetical protein
MTTRWVRRVQRVSNSGRARRGPRPSRRWSRHTAASRWQPTGAEVAPPRILLAGMGELGSRVLALLCRELPGSAAIHVLSRDATAARATVNLAVQGALQLGPAPAVTCREVDVRNEDQTAQAIADFRPDLVFSSVTQQSWWVTSTLPPVASARIAEARFGPWLPMHLALVRHLMVAVRQAGPNAIVVNAAFPDAVHPVLDTVGLSPDIGIGNVANVVPGVRLALAEQLAVAVDRVSVRLYAAHYVSHRASRTGDAGEAAFVMRVLLDGDDITDRVELGNPFARLPTVYRRPGGRDGQLMTACSALTVLRALLGARGTEVHAPGPVGLPGGYSVRVSSGGIDVNIPPGSGVDQLVEVNLGGLAADGIEAIDGLGGVTFRDREAGVMADVLGYKCSYLPLADVDGRARELGARYAEYASAARG